MFKSIDGGMIICDQTLDHLNDLFLHHFKKLFWAVSDHSSPFFLPMVEICVYNSYILWLTKLKCVCQTDHLFTKQRASELMIWLRYAIEVKYFLYCADIVLPTAYLESQIPESFFFFKINVNV